MPSAKLTARVGLKEERLRQKLAAHSGLESDLERILVRAEGVGSLALSGRLVRPEDVEAALVGAAASDDVVRWLAARRAVEPGTPFSVAALLRWHGALLGRAGVFRREALLDRSGAPPALIEERLGSLAEWLAAPSGSDLGPAARGALVLARIVEIAPFDEGDGLIARIAAGHVMAQAGVRRPILQKEDESRLASALAAACRLDTGPLVALLEEATDRALDLMLARLDDAGLPAG